MRSVTSLTLILVAACCALQAAAGHAATGDGIGPGAAALLHDPVSLVWTDAAVDDDARRSVVGPGAIGAPLWRSLSPSDSAVGPPAKPAKDRTGDIIVFTAHQGWLSRIYLLNTDGSVIRYFQYDFYYFADLEVVNNEVYAAEAFAPRVLKVDLDTGDLEVVVDDWSLYYFYDVAFDGTYFYVNEWDLNRYEFDGTKDGMAPFDDSVVGAAWDGTYYWTLNDDENLVKCWDISLWPTVTEVPANAFRTPTAHCRGLWFDGEYFWTAESIEDTLGQILQFDYNGQIVNHWLAPAFAGWSACVVTGPMPGDVDGDDDVDLDDYAAFAGCMTAPCELALCDPPLYVAGCEGADLDDDGDVDLVDFGEFQTLFPNP